MSSAVVLLSPQEQVENARYRLDRLHHQLRVNHGIGSDFDNECRRDFDTLRQLHQAGLLSALTDQDCPF